MSSSPAAAHILSLTKTIVVYISSFVLITGLVGNCLNIILFTTLRSLRSKPCGFYFLIESIVDLSQILFGLIAYIIEQGFGVDMSTNSVVWCKIKTTIIQSLHLIFLATVCLAAFDQFLSTHYLYSLRQMSTRKFAQNLLLSSFSVVIIHMILSLIYFELHSQFFGCIIYDAIVVKYYNFFFYPVFNGLLPVMITVTFSLLAFYNVRHLVRRQIPVERRQFDRQLTAMTFARIIAYICLGIPYFVYRIYTIQIPVRIDYSLQYAINGAIGTMAGSLAYLNYVISFYVFLLASSRFRHQVKHLVKKKCCRPLKRLFKKRSPIVSENQIVPEPSLPNVSTIRLTY